MSNNSSNPTTEDKVPFPPSLILFIAFQQLTFLLSCIGNCLVIVVFVKFIKRTPITNKFIISLAIADCLTGVATGFQLFYFLFPELSENRYGCFVRFQLVAFLGMTSQLTVTFTTLDRYIAICHPHQYQTVLTNVKANILVFVAWIYSFVICSIPFMGTHKWIGNSQCVYDVVFETGLYLGSALTNIVFTLLSFAMYIFILRKAWVYYKRVRPSNGNYNTRNKPIERDVRGAKVMGIVTIIFTLCWAPFTAYQLKYAVGVENRSELETSISNWVVFLGLFNSVINPFIYAWQRRDFNIACKKLIGRKTPKNLNNNATVYCSQTSSS